MKRSFTSGRTVNEAAYLYQLMARRFGTNNLPDCSNMYHESSGAASGHHRHRQRHREPAGFRGGGGYFHFRPKPRHQSSAYAELLQAAKRNGAEIVAVNPLKEAGLLGFAHPQEVRGMLGMAARWPSNICR